MKTFPKPPSKIIVHCSDSNFGTQRLIRKWHTDPRPRGRGWSDTGYHFIILNELPWTTKKEAQFLNGQVETGRPLNFIGAHCRGQNSVSIGICLIGKKVFTAAQFDALAKLCTGLSKYYGKVLPIFGHRDFNKYKTCPNFEVRDILKQRADQKMKGRVESKERELNFRDQLTDHKQRIMVLEHILNV